MRKLKLSILSLAFAGLGFQTTQAQETKTESFKKTFKMEGRIMYDFNFLSAGEDYNYAGNEFRRVRLAAKGKVAKNIGYKAEFDFAGGKLGFRDVYLKFALPSSLGAVKVGSFTEPSSLDNMTSSKYITFFERSMMSNTQPFKYNAGFMYDNQKLLDGKMGIQMSYTFNGDKSAAYLDKSIKDGANFVARLTGVVLQDKESNRVVHIGANYENRKNDSDSYSYKFRAENHMGHKYKASATGVFENTSDIGFELASTFGPFSIQGEYEMSSIKTDIDTYDASGYYAFASFFVTGEHRPYKKGTFGRVKPKKQFCLKDGGYGAFELVARLSTMDYSTINLGYTNSDDVDYSIDKISNITAGFNWYLNNNTRVMYNYTSGAFDGENPYGDGNNLTGHLLRFQVDF